MDKGSVRVRAWARLGLVATVGLCLVLWLWFGFRSWLGLEWVYG
jgi:hypothetical protein